jgi:hypothetical protein
MSKTISQKMVRKRNDVKYLTPKKNRHDTNNSLFFKDSPHRVFRVLLVVIVETLIIILMHIAGLWFVISTIDRLFIVIGMIVILFFSASGFDTDKNNRRTI